MNPKPLEGIRIVEMGTAEAEGIAALLLSDYGAEVIRLEFPQERSGKENVRICDRGKKRVWFDPEREEDRKWLEGILAHTDGIVTSFPEAQMAQWELDGDTLAGRYPHLVYVSVTGYGASGPYAGRPWNEASVQAESGFMSVTGPEGGEPVRCGGDMAVFAGAANACIAALMCLIEAGRTGSGRRADVSLMDALLYGMENQYSIYLKSGQVPGPMGNHYALSAPVGDYPCRDGSRLMISVATDAQWKNFAEVLGQEAWLENPDYRNVKERLRHYQKLGKEVEAAFMEHTSEELIGLLQSRHCIYGRINDFHDVVKHPQTKARKMLIDVEYPDGQIRKAPSNPIVMDGAKPAGTVIHDTILCRECDIV